MRLSPRRELLAAVALAFTYATLAATWPVLIVIEWRAARRTGARRA